MLKQHSTPPGRMSPGPETAGFSLPKFRQPIVFGDHGSDVWATKLALRRMGFHAVNLKRPRVAGHSWESAIRVVQHQHGLHIDGIYGAQTHAHISPHFTAWAARLYRQAALRRRGDYVNPFKNAYVQIGRVDEGVDYHGRGPIHALSDMVIIGVDGSGWPDHHYINARLTNGRHAGRFYYLAEAITPTVRAGQRLRAGDLLAEFRWDAAPGLYPGIEHGWGSSITNLTWAAVTHRTGPPPYSNTGPGLAFARFLHAIGAPAPAVGPGPEFV